MRDVKRCLTALAGLLLAGSVSVGTAGQAAPAEDAGNLKVTVDYKGPGTVDKTHQLFVWIFDTPDISESSTPVATDVVTANGGSASFTGLPKTVYLAAAFNEKGEAYDQSQGPPPPGTPITIYGGVGTATGVPTGGADAAVTVDFDDSMRMP
jgi:hypothetical protein